MKPNITLAETAAPNGARITLVEHDGSYCIRVNGQQLMHSSVASSEIELGVVGCERHRDPGLAPRLLIGGLGLGFTLKSVLATVGSQATVHVAELMPEIVEWNRSHLAEINGDALADSRVEALVEDVRSVIQRAASAPYDAIMLDIDNGTTAMVKTENHLLYTESGLRKIRSALQKGGRLVVWSACADAALEKRLTKAGFTVQAVPSKVHAKARRSAYMLYVADLP